MENGDFSNVYENIENATLYEIPNLEDAEVEQIYDQVSENLVFPSPMVYDTVDMECQESPENSHTNSLTFQPEYDGGEETDSSHHETPDRQDTPEDQQHKQIQLLSPRLSNESSEGMAFENKELSLNDFSLKKIQGTSKNFPVTFRFPSSNNLEENNNFQKEDHEIFLIVRVSAFARYIHSCVNQT
ncbi:uncharacterized protein LOC128339728 isoform X2 [Hemicordylus capensis]|nr:uncharacterized protein LOC128339728 isoform X2 [Hemicordylus capensis]XP_053140067.1 uncharacterized protein LOC128339728 isoform X2 [Hemicordylus capensis]